MVSRKCLWLEPNWELNGSAAADVWRQGLPCHLNSLSDTSSHTP